MCHLHLIFEIVFSRSEQISMKISLKQNDTQKFS